MHIRFLEWVKQRLPVRAGLSLSAVAALYRWFSVIFAAVRIQVVIDSFHTDDIR